MTSHKYFVMARLRKKGQREKSGNRNVAANRCHLLGSTWRMRNADTAKGQESFAIMSMVLFMISPYDYRADL